MNNGWSIMANTKLFGEGFHSLPDSSHIKSLELINTQNQHTHILENVPGKKASVKILHGIAVDNDNIINKQAAAWGLALFGEYTDEERQSPNSHPNIRLLIEIIDGDQTWEVTTT